jgi:hypothetical protein
MVGIAAVRHRLREPPAHADITLRLPQQQCTAIGGLIAAFEIDGEFLAADVGGSRAENALRDLPRSALCRFGRRFGHSVPALSYDPPPPWPPPGKIRRREQEALVGVSPMADVWRRIPRLN